MDEIEKIAIRLKHWIGHNLEHVKAYEDVARKILDLGLAEASDDINQAIELSSRANEKFQSALSFIESSVGKHIECSETHEGGHCHSAQGPHTHEPNEKRHGHS